jgi:hypothetical protein
MSHCAASTALVSQASLTGELEFTVSL